MHIYFTWKHPKTFFFSFVDGEDSGGDSSYTTRCIACGEANQETKERYPMEWCQPMVPMEKLQETKIMLQNS